MLSFAILTALCAVAALALPVEDGRWDGQQYGDSGTYSRPPNEGKYVHIPNPYIHIDNPYDGGFGPYAHQHEPYVGAESVNQYKLVLKEGDDLPYYKDGYYINNGIKIIRQTHNTAMDKYDFDFETENKIRAKENAVLKNPNQINEGIASKGFYEYIGTDGFMYRVDYTADENGFRPRTQRIETPYSGKWVREKVN